MVIRSLSQALLGGAALGLTAVSATAAPQGGPEEAPTRAEREARAYRVTSCELPEGVSLEVGGLEVVPGPAGPRILAVTRRGEMWGIDGFAGEEVAEAPTFTRVADGLHEPLGLLRDEDALLIACRGKLVRLQDLDGDLVYETHEAVTDWWRISGNYHEYNFGPAPAIDGSYWITTNKPFGGEPFGRVTWRGYALRITPGGEVTPMCAGLRSPAGVNTSPTGEVFYTDNQGEWCGASKLSLLRPGSYHGHPHGIGSTELPEWPWPQPKALPEGQLFSDIAASGEFPAFQMPSVWFPHGEMGRSPAGFVWDLSGGKFGPFEGQIFVADQYDAAVFRVDLERVGSQWQGACFRFREGLACGVIRVRFTDGGALLLGETDRGWGSRGSLTEGIQRLDWTGAMPFEIHTMRLLEDRPGFRLRLTAPATQESLADLSGYSMESYTYQSTQRYGSAELARETPTLTEATPHADGLGVDLVYEGLREGFVHELEAAGIRSADGGLDLLHTKGYYTLVRMH